MLILWQMRRKVWVTYGGIAGSFDQTTWHHDKKKIKKRFLIFWEVGEVQGVSIFRLGTVAKVELDSGWVGAGYETHRVPSYDLDTPSDALENQIGPSVWPL